MQFKTFFLALFFLTVFSVSAQVTTDPEFPTAADKVTIIFDSSQEDRLGYFTGELYAHTGVTIEGKGRWQNVIESWGNNTTQPKLTNKGNGIYELEISPNINSFYNVAAGDKVTELCFVFRSADASKQTNDLFVDVYEGGLTVKITAPSGSSIFEKNETIAFAARSSVESNLSLWVDDQLLTQATAIELSTDYTFTTGGRHWLIARATTDSTVTDSLQVFVRNEVTEETKPAGYKKGINYTSDNSAALVLWAPMKEYVFVLGDFNNWQLSDSYQMKKDGDYFWLDITGLDPGKEYAFQYFIDGEIKIADPYTEKILDPWNDHEITEEIYPGLIGYPEGKTQGIVSVLQTAQEEYVWEVEDFRVPETGKLVIYELLIRDFETERSYKAVREKLDYLEDLNINVLELMPVNEFEGNNSWGYNPSFYFAPDKYYGPKNELKKLIDECHKRGIAVVIDMVLNHSYGQSPFVQMYMDNWTILPENPWYNVSSPNQVFQWGFDLNHEAEAVKELVDSVNSFWINEYKVDGFRFDFTKGFTQTPGDGWAYDAPRISILKRMADEVWKRKPDALVILEHLSDNREETELANHGMLLWGNMHGAYQSAATGHVNSSDLSWAMYNERGWNTANLVSYPESHDEERIMYTLKNAGLSNDTYNTRNQHTALDRIELNSLFHIPLPGPKMIWQFGERGYDLSINRCENGSVSSDCRLSPKPPYWQYLNNTHRTDLFRVMAKLNELKQSYEEFTPDNFTYDLAGAVKTYTLSKNGNHVIAVGNFDIVEHETTLTFPKTGKYYRFFSRDSIEITSTEQQVTLAPGGYRLYSTREFEDPHVVTDVEDRIAPAGEVFVYPNPATRKITVRSNQTISSVQVYSLSGTLLFETGKLQQNTTEIDVTRFTPGVYFVRTSMEDKTSTQKIVVK